MKTRRKHLTVKRNFSTETLRTLEQKHFTLTVKRNTSKAKGKTQVELVLGQKIRLATIKYNDARKKFSLSRKKTGNHTTIVIIRRVANTSWIQHNLLEQTLPVSRNQIASCCQETNTTDGTRDLVDDELSVQNENKDQPSLTSSTWTTLRRTQRFLKFPKTKGTLLRSYTERSS